MGKREWKFSVYETPEGCDVVWDMRFPMEPGKFHVIEYQAFEAVVKERDEYRAAHTHLSNIDKRSIGSIILERDALAAQLAEEKDSLAHYKNELSLSLIASDRYKAQLAELKSYIPKVPTQPYEKEMAKQLSDLKRNAMSLRGMLAAHLAGGQPIDVTCVLAFDAFMKRMGE